MASLWRRIVFNVLISNTDDHLRNHGCVYDGQAGWRLPPAYDLNPVPVDLKPRVLSTANDLDDQTASLELAFSVASYFRLDAKQSRAVAREVGRAVARWRKVAMQEFGVTAKECDRMASALEHGDTQRASAAAS